MNFSQKISIVFFLLQIINYFTEQQTKMTNPSPGYFIFSEVW